MAEEVTRERLASSISEMSLREQKEELLPRAMAPSWSEVGATLGGQLEVAAELIDPSRGRENYFSLASLVERIAGLPCPQDALSVSAQEIKVALEELSEAEKGVDSRSLSRARRRAEGGIAKSEMRLRVMDVAGEYGSEIYNRNQGKSLVQGFVDLLDRGDITQWEENGLRTIQEVRQLAESFLEQAQPEAVDRLLADFGTLESANRVRADYGPYFSEEGAGSGLAEFLCHRDQLLILFKFLRDSGLRRGRMRDIVGSLSPLATTVVRDGEVAVSKILVDRSPETLEALEELGTVLKRVARHNLVSGFLLAKYNAGDEKEEKYLRRTRERTESKIVKNRTYLEGISETEQRPQVLLGAIADSTESVRKGLGNWIRERREEERSLSYQLRGWLRDVAGESLIHAEGFLRRVSPRLLSSWRERLIGLPLEEQRDKLLLLGGTAAAIGLTTDAPSAEGETGPTPVISVFGREAKRLLTSLLPNK